MIDEKLKIVYDIKESDSKYIPNDEELKLIDKDYKLSFTRDIKLEREFQWLIKQYPHLPQFRYNLLRLYQFYGQAE